MIWNLAYDFQGKLHSANGMLYFSNYSFIFETELAFSSIMKKPTSLRKVNFKLEKYI